MWCGIQTPRLLLEPRIKGVLTEVTKDNGKQHREYRHGRFPGRVCVRVRACVRVRVRACVRARPWVSVCMSHLHFPLGACLVCPVRTTGSCHANQN